jgi:hypothetical protein
VAAAAPAVVAARAEATAIDTVEQPSAARAAAQPWIDAMRAREANAPSGVSIGLWKQTASLEKRGISADEVSNYLDSGELAELETLASAIEEKGSWPDVECFTFLVSMRRAAIAAEKADAQKLLGTIPADAAERPAIETFVADCERADRAMHDGLQSIYRTATYARERTQLRSLDRADRLEAQGDLEGAKKIRDRAALLLHEEAKYRTSLPKARFDSSSAYELAAGAQISRARISGNDAPLFLGNAADAGNGAPGAGSLLASAVAAQGGQDHSTLALEGARQDSFAEYFAGRGSSARAAYFEARAKQAGAAEARLALYGDAAKLSGEDALAAASVAQERRVVLEELEAPLVSSLAADRTLAETRSRRDELVTAKLSAEEELTRAEAEHGAALEGIGLARSQASAVFGDSFKTTDETRRDQESIDDAAFLAESAGTRLALVGETNARLAPLVDRAEADLAAAEPRTRELARDAELVARTVKGSDRAAAFRVLRAETDEAAALGAAYLQRADQQLTSREAQTFISAGRVDLAAYGARAVELDLFALGDRSNALPRLDAAAAMLASAGLEDESLSLGAVDAYAALAEANSDYRPAKSREYLAAAEELANNPSAEASRERIAGAALSSFARSDARFEDIAIAGNYDPTAQDTLVAQARRLAPRDERLAQLDAAVALVPDILATSSAQLENGFDATAAQTRTYGRSQISVTQAQMSTLATGLIWTASGWDMREDLARSSEGVTALSIGTGKSLLELQTSGEQQISAVFSQARAEGRTFEMLGALRILGADGAAEKDKAAADSFISARVPLVYSEEHANDYIFFNRSVVSAGAGATLVKSSPLASALEGPVLGYERAHAAHGNSIAATITPSMQQTLEAHGAWLEKSADGMEMMLALNTTCEVGIGIAATWGIGAAGALAEGGAALNTARNGAQALSAARSFGLASRASQMLGAARTAHPFLYSATLTGTVGVGSLGTSYSSRKLFGASSGLSRGTDVAMNFLPVGTGVRTTGIRGLMPAVGFGGAQTFGTVLATPRLADVLGVESEGGKAALALALNVLIPATAAAAFHRNPAASSVLAQELGQLENPDTNGGAVLARLSSRLEAEGGLSRADAGSVARSVERAVLEREIGARASSEQALAGAPLSEARIGELALDTAARMGLNPAEARAISERGQFCDWVHSFFSESAGADAKFRGSLVDAASPDGKKALATMTDGDLRLIYPQGAYPRAFAELAGIDGFVDFAKANPSDARALADATGMYGVTGYLRSMVSIHGPTIWAREAARLGAENPTVAPHPTQKGYEVIRRAPGARNFPEVVFSPDPSLDHNGAFHQHGAGAKTDLPDFARVQPNNLIGKMGVPLTSWDGIIQLSGHGSRSGFDIPTPDAAKMVAKEIITRQAAGARTDYVLLRSCHQRDAGYLFFGESNGQRFRRLLHQELKKAGYRGPTVEVLAADRPGPTARFTQRSYFPKPELKDGWPTYRYQSEWAQYRPATYARPYMTHEELLFAAAGGAGAVAAGAAAGLYATYSVVSAKKEGR